MSGMVGRVYLDLGDRISGRRVPPEPVTVLTAWRSPSKTCPPAPRPPWLHWHTGPRTAPRNVLVQRPNGRREVVPFSRRLRRPQPTKES
jgi:hypothetical protein